MSATMTYCATCGSESAQLHADLCATCWRRCQRVSPRLRAAQRRRGRREALVTTAVFWFCALVGAAGYVIAAVQGEGPL